MADWTTLPNTAVGVGGLPSGTTVTALRDNPVAIAEGAAGAPRVEARGREFGYYGSLSSTGTDAIGFTDIDPLIVSQLFLGWSNTSGSTRQFQVRASNDNGSTWTDWITIFSNVSGTSIGSIALLNSTTGVMLRFDLPTLFPTTTNFGITSINAIQARSGGSGTNNRIAGYALFRGDAS